MSNCQEVGHFLPRSELAEEVWFSAQYVCHGGLFLCEGDKAKRQVRLSDPWASREKLFKNEWFAFFKVSCAQLSNSAFPWLLDHACTIYYVHDLCFFSALTTNRQTQPIGKLNLMFFCSAEGVGG